MIRRSLRQTQINQISSDNIFLYIYKMKALIIPSLSHSVNNYHNISKNKGTVEQ
jgi:hypothetical protein